jgi:hypothetical protein
MSHRPRALVFTAVALGALSLPAAAHAQEIGFISAGVVVSIPLGGAIDQTGLGFELSYTDYGRAQSYLGVGAFVQAQYLFGGGWRADLGAQGTAFFGGAELGLAVVSPRGQGPSFGLHVAPFLSVGYGSAAFRWTPLLVGPSAHASGYEINLAPKLWWEHDRDRGRVGDAYVVGCHFGCVIGRPLVVDGVPVVADAAGDPAWGGPVAATEADLSDAQRAALAEHWTRAMREEHASVAAFARLSLQLMALGAPPELLRRTHAAALDEVDHARRCAALAARFAGEPRSPGALPAACAPVEAVDLAALAVATLREGCVGEAVFAAAAARARDLATDPDVREALTVIARDEAEHAALAWDLVAWCVEAGGSAVREALAAAAGALPTSERASDGAADVALLGFGWTPDGAFASGWAHRRREALRRVGPGRSRVGGRVWKAPVG